MPALTPDQERTSPQFFDILNFVMKFTPTLPAEKAIRDRFATIGIGPDGSFDAEKLSPEMRTAVQDGMADAWAELDALKKNEIDTGKLTAASLFGTRDDLKGNYLYRMAGAVLGIYGNTAAEALYPSFSTDAAGAPLTGANEYTYRFAPGQLPPVNAFWSLTMYGLPKSLLVANPINRYLINSPMLRELVPDADGGYTSTCSGIHQAGARTQLAAGTRWPVFAGPAALLAQARRPRRSMAGTKAREGGGVTRLLTDPELIAELEPIVEAGLNQHFAATRIGPRTTTCHGRTAPTTPPSAGRHGSSNGRRCPNWRASPWSPTC